ncbi:MAG TPA: MFS transporter [Novosphingobium sp.]
MTRERARTTTGLAIGAWLVASVFYFYQYVLRSAPSVMVPQLTDAFGLSAGGLAAMLGLLYYGYSPFSLLAGVAMDQFGPRKVVPLGAACVALGSLMFASGEPTIASIGRFLQGAGGVFALIGAAFIATTRFPAARAATLIGLTQMFGMAGGSAGQFAVGPAIAGGLPWQMFWIGMAALGLAVAGFLFALLPEAPAKPPDRASGGRRMRDAWSALGTVFANRQSWLCGLIAGLMFIPTTIFDMTWGVRFLEEGHELPYTEAVMRSASVPLGWIIGCPLMGWLSDRLGKRRPVIIGCAAVLLITLVLILYGPPELFPPMTLGLIAGIASGAAMIPYTVIKEANLPEHSGTATGVVNFINFSFSALLGPVFGALLTFSSDRDARNLWHYQITFEPLIYGVAIAILLTLALKETGKGRQPAPAVTRTN